ncbi:MAG: ribosome biogenesis GTPase YlqF [Heliobacteriaceae bacterium]|nr:ribosome biogenesis GTPase YlqF [Heliobacteriaceae bacterium]MDD4587045.1 ribosome biogenesis GTPase YlqF [Heliobacteriaceae bacterium]
MNQVQWFPGHMAKARKQITADLAKVDLAFELLDARIPLSSRNPELDAILGTKPRVILLNKADLADVATTGAFVAYFGRLGTTALPVNAVSGTGVKALYRAVASVGEPLVRRWQKRGMRPRSFRAMVVGIPNVGKSSLINRLAGRRRTVTANRPGVTKGPQWIRIEEKIDLLDMPGMLWPKIGDPLTGLKLAATGAVSDLVVQRPVVAGYVLRTLHQLAPGLAGERYGLDLALVPPEAWLEVVARRHGFLGAQGLVDTEKAAVQVLADFRGGRLGRYTLDELPQ